MSHVRTNKSVITELQLARKTTGLFPKLTWMEGQKTFNWFGKWVNDYSRDDAAYKNGIDVSQYGHCEHAIKVEGCDYEIGVVKRKDGQGYSLVWDFYGQGRRIDEVIGNGAEKFMVEYQRAFMEQHGLANGCIVDTTRYVDENGENITEVKLMYNE